MKTPEQMYQDIAGSGDTTLEEFIEWVEGISFEGYKEGYSDGSLNMNYEHEHGILRSDD